MSDQYVALKDAVLVCAVLAPVTSTGTPTKFSDDILLPLTSIFICLKWFTEFGHLNRGDMLTSEQHRSTNEKKKF